MDDDVGRPDACPKEGQVESFDAGWNAHKVGLGRKTVEVLSPDRGWALLGYDTRAMVAAREKEKG
jgi:hypothetical protein